MPDAVPGSQTFFTLGRLAERLNVSAHKLKYAIDQYRVTPVTRVGILRCWSEEQIPQIKSALARVASNRKGVL